MAPPKLLVNEIQFNVIPGLRKSVNPFRWQMNAPFEPMKNRNFDRRWESSG
jgi:hypothetical protein